MKLRIILATLLTAVALSACDKAEKAADTAKEATTEVVANVAEKATEATKEVVTNVADKAKEVATDATAKVAEKASAATDAVADVAEKAKEATTEAVSNVAEKAKEVTTEAVSNVTEKAKEATAAVTDTAANAVDATKDAASNMAEKAKDTASDAVSGVADKAKEATAAVTATAATAVEATKDAASSVAEKATEATTEKAKEAASEAKQETMPKTEEVPAAKEANAKSAADTKVGFVYVGPIGDHGWTYQHDQSRLAVEKALGVTTTFVESVPEGADAERVITQLAAAGNDMIFTTSFGYMNPTLKVAKRFPKIKFEHATGYKRSDNVTTYSARFYEGRAILGTIAGKMSKSNTIGYIGSFPIPEVIRGINAFTLAARKVNPEIKVKVIWVNSWFDPGKEGDAAKTLIDQGADIISQHTDSPAPLQVAEKRGVFAFGQASDMKAFAPKAQLTSIIDNWDRYYIERVKAMMDGTWKPADTWGGIDSGMVEMAPYGDAVPEDVRAMAEKIKAGTLDGSFHAFTGPIKNQAGEVMVKEGEVMSDADLSKLNWYVEGVEGSIPKQLLSQKVQYLKGQ